MRPPGPAPMTFDGNTRRSRALILISVGSALSALDTSMMFVAYPSIRSHFDNSPLSVVSWVLTAYQIVVAALLIPAGRLADRFGRRKVFLFSLASYTVGSLLSAVAPNVAWLIAARVVAALGGALLTPTALAIIMSMFPAHRRAWAIGVWATISGTIATLGPTIGALLVTYASWRWTFLVNVPVGITSMLLARRMIDESKAEDSGPLPDPLGVVLVAVGLGSLSFAIVKSNAWGWTGSKTLTMFALAVAVLAIVARRCVTHRSPVVDPLLFRSPMFRFAALAGLGVGMTFFGGYYLFVQFLTLGWRYSIIQAGLLLIPMTLASSVVGVPAGKLMDRYGNRALMVPAMFIFVVAMIYLGVWLDDSRSIVRVWLPVALGVGITNAVFLPGCNSAGARGVPEDMLGTAAGVIQTLIRVGGALGTSLSIALVGDFRRGDSVTDLHPTFLALAGAGVIAALAATPLAPKRSE